MAGLIGGLSVDQQTELIYIGYFNRAADGGGFNLWEQQYATATTAGGESAAVALSNIANSFIHQTETFELFPILSTSLTYPVTDSFTQGELSSLINTVYMNLFSHGADPAGAAYWLGQLETGAIPLGKAILAIANGALGADAVELQNKIIAADFFTTQTSASDQGLTAPLSTAFFDEAHTILNGINGTALNDASVAASEAATMAFIVGNDPPVGPIGPLGPSTFTLTTAIDNITSTNAGDLIIGTITGVNSTSTLNPGDQIAMAGGTINIVDSNNAGVPVNELAGISITGPFNFVVQNTSAALAVFDYAGSNVMSVTSLNSLGDVEFTNLPNGTAVILSSSGGNSAGLVEYSMTSASAPIALGVDGGDNGGEFLNADSNAAPTSATIASTGLANGTASAPIFFDLANNNLSVATLAINAASNLIAEWQTSDFVAGGATLTVSGAAPSVNLESNVSSLGNWLSIDASGLTTGGLTVNSDANLVSFVGGGGGNNNLTSMGGMPGTAISLAATSIDGGGGTGNILASNLVDHANAAIFANWQTLDVTNQGGVTLDASAMTNDTIDGVQYSGNDANRETILNLAPSITVTQAGAGLIDAGPYPNAGLTITHASAAGDASALVFNNTSATATSSELGYFNSTGDVADTISSSATFATSTNTLGQMLMTDNHLTTVTVSGAALFAFGSASFVANTGDGVVADTGLSSAVATTTASSFSLLDASATTGGVLLWAGASTSPSANDTVTYTGLTIKGGSGLDFIENDAKGGTVIDGNHDGDTVFLASSGMTGTVGNGTGDGIVIGYSELGSSVADGAAVGATVTFGAAASANLQLGRGADIGAAALSSGNLGTNAFNSANVVAAAPGMHIQVANAYTGLVINEQSAATGAANLAQAINAVATALRTLQIGVFVSGGDEYLVSTSATDQSGGATGDDQVVHLIGVNTLIHGAATFGSIVLA